MCKSCIPLSMGENDIYYRSYIKSITYGRYYIERLFTAGGVMHGDLRKRLKEETLGIHLSMKKYG